MGFRGAYMFLPLSRRAGKGRWVCRQAAGLAVFVFVLGFVFFVMPVFHVMSACLAVFYFEVLNGFFDGDLRVSPLLSLSSSG